RREAHRWPVAAATRRPWRERRARRASAGVHQPARLCAGNPLPLLRLGLRLSTLLSATRLASARATIALPPLRAHRAAASGLPVVRQPGSRADRARYPARGGGAHTSSAAG